MTRDEYNKMDITEAIATWNEENGLNDDDDLYIFDNSSPGLNARFYGAYDAIEAVNNGDYDFNDDYAYISWCGLYSFTESDDDLAPWNYFSKNE